MTSLKGDLLGREFELVLGSYSIAGRWLILFLVKTMVIRNFTSFENLYLNEISNNYFINYSEPV